MPGVGLDRQCLQLLTADGDAHRVGAGAAGGSACTCNPVRVRVAAIVATTTSWLVSGRPRQFIVIWRTGGVRSCSTSRCPAGGSAP